MADVDSLKGRVRQLTDTKLEASPLPERLRALAREQAFGNHREAIIFGLKGQHVAASGEKHDADFGFSVCPHPDCQLVRAGEGAP